MLKKKGGRKEEMGPQRIMTIQEVEDFKIQFNKENDKASKLNES